MAYFVSGQRDPPRRHARLAQNSGMDLTQRNFVIF
jgi:hypothetical protein